MASEDQLQTSNTPRAPPGLERIYLNNASPGLPGQAGGAAPSSVPGSCPDPPVPTCSHFWFPGFNDLDLEALSNVFDPEHLDLEAISHAFDPNHLDLEALSNVFDPEHLDLEALSNVFDPKHLDLEAINNIFDPIL